MNDKDNPPIMPRHPDKMTDEQWDEWRAVWNAWTEHHFGPFTPVSEPGW